MAVKVNGELKALDIHDVLSNERRQLVLSFLRQDGGISSARALSERIAEVETGQTPPPRNIRQSAYVSLHQTHLPKLDNLGIVTYDESSKSVALTERARQVHVYMESVPRFGISWSEYYFAISTLSLLLMYASWMGVPVIHRIGPPWWAVSTLAVIGFSGIYQTIQQRSSLLHRLRHR